MIPKSNTTSNKNLLFERKKIIIKKSKIESVFQMVLIVALLYIVGFNY
jgi:hypothetical protein